MKNLEKWIGYRFDRSDDCETGYDKKAVNGLARNLRAYLKKNIKGFEDLKITTNYYDISGFVKANGKYCYISMPDLRYQDRWVNDILVREAEGMRDFKGGRNQFTELNNLVEDMENILN